MPGAGGVTIHRVGEHKMFYTDKNNSLVGTIATVDRDSKKYIISAENGKFYTLGFEDDFANELSTDLTSGSSNNVGDYVVYYDNKTENRKVGKITKKDIKRKFYVIDSSVIIDFSKTGGRKTLTRRKKNKKSRKARKFRTKYFFF
jgi:hypothetical protein